MNLRSLLTHQPDAVALGTARGVRGLGGARPRRFLGWFLLGRMDSRVQQVRRISTSAFHKKGFLAGSP